MAADNLEAKVREIIADRLQVDPSSVTTQASFVEDLGADSLDLTELVMAFEEEFKVSIPDDEVDKLRTVGSAVEYLQKKMEDSK